MITEKNNIPGIIDDEQKGLTLYFLTNPPHAPEKVRMYARAVLSPGGEVYYHKHEGESESYYILQGEGVYNDDGIESIVRAGDITFTSSGGSHGIRNDGTEELHFIALIVLD